MPDGAVSQSPVGALRAAWLLTRLRSRRLWNQMGRIYRFRKASSARAGTARKSSTGWLITGFVMLCMLANVVNLSYRSFANMEKALGNATVAREAQRPWLGVRIGAVTAEVAARLGIAADRGVLVTGVFDDTEADRAGLRTDDVIISLDGRRIGDMADLTRVVASVPIGKTVDIGILRGGEELDRRIRMGVSASGARSVSRPVPPAPGSVFAPGLLGGATLAATLLLLSSLFMTIASREIIRPEWDLEWLVTLPLPLPTLLASRLFERAVTNATGWTVLGPFLSVLAFESGYGFAAPLLGFALTFALLLIIATLQTLVDTGLRLSLAPSRLRNLQALVSIVAVLPLMLVLSMGLREDAFMLGPAAAMPGWTAYLPSGLAVRALAAADAGTALSWSALLLCEACAVVGIGYALLERQLREGVVAVGVREAATRLKRAPADEIAGARVATSVRSGLWGLLPAVQRRELRFLARDRAFMAQTLLLPVVTVAAQIFLYSKLDVFGDAMTHPENLSALAFGVSAYMLIGSAFQTLNAEGQALWILYCVPRPLEAVLWQKAKLWATAALVYPLVMFTVAIWLSGGLSAQLAMDAAIVLFGVPIFAVIATALGVFGCDPLAQEVQRRVRPTYVYLYLVLASLYAYAFYATTIWQRGAMLILTALLAVALWQKARDRFDTLLDPAATPVARVSVADGMIAALLFFVLQGLVIVILRANEVELPNVVVVWIGFCAAGAATYAAMRLVYRLARTQDVPGMLGPGLPRALLLGAAGGVAAALFGLFYLWAVVSFDLFAEEHGRKLITGSDTIWWLGTLAVAAAPIFEEFIFRGLIFRGLRRSYGLMPAMLASAAIFAILHPPVSVIPVFVMAVCAAYVYERSRMLAAPMLVHALYNAAVIGLQWSLMP